MPTVSILMSVYNGEKYLLPAIKSIQSQTLQDFEVVIVDDGSIDSTNLIIQSILNTDVRFKAIRNSNNLGLPKSLNLAASESSGEFQMVMGSDDLLGRTYLDDMIEEIRSSQSEFIYSDYYRIDEKGKDLGVSRVEDAHLLVCGMVMGVSRVWRSDLLQRLGGFNPKTFMYEDFEFSVRVHKSGAKIKKVGEQTYLYRIHPAQLTNSKSLPPSYYTFRLALVKNDLGSLTTKEKGRALVSFAHFCVSRKEYLFFIKVCWLILRHFISASIYIISKLLDFWP